MSQKEGWKNWSNKQLCFIFIGFTVLLTILRWDSEAWIQSEIDKVIAQNNLNITYQTLDLNGTKLQLSDVYLHVPNMPKPLQLDSVQLQFDWSELWHGRLAILANINNSFMHMSTLLSMHNPYINLSNMIGKVNVQAAQAWYGKETFAQGTGSITWHGNAGINISTGLPIKTDLQVRWQNANVHIMQQDYALGDYALKLTQSENNQIWSLQGGEQLQIQGNGTLHMNHPSALMWPLQGNVDVQVSPTSPLSALLPKTVTKIQLRGVLSQPQWLM